MTYLSIRIFIFIWVLILGLYFFFQNIIYVLPLLLLFFFILFLFRKKTRLKIIEEKENGLVFSPTSGIVKSVKEDSHFYYIHIRRSLFNEWGIYMPTCGKVEYVNKYSGKRIWKYSGKQKYTDIERNEIKIKSKLGALELVILHSKLGEFESYIDSGDYGFIAARIGHIKGIVDMILVLPKDFSLVVEESQVVSSGRTVIAANTAVHS